MMPSNFELRLKHLEDNIRQDQDLLKKYQDSLRYEDDPRRQAKYEREIQQLRESANCYQKEYDELQMQITGESTVQMQNVATQLQQMNTKIDRLYAGQKAIYENINHLRQGLLARYDAGEQRIIAALTEQLDQSQMIMIATVLDAIETNQVTDGEMQLILQGIQQNINKLQQSGTALPPSQSALVEVINAPELDFKHRLKVGIPIVPFILDYEGELELGTGIDLEAAWKTLIMRLKGK
ncbi:alr1851 [Nostoc sp. PCC 7120 = FACHB-418]|nr:alr1851 [Nostoc sp. PCC 7120 = FACHB-418]